MPDREIWLGLVMAGGLSIEWLRTLLRGAGAPDDFGSLESLARRVPPGANGVTFRPFLEGAATPWGRLDARAGFDGLGTSHGAPELVRAVYEGVAFNVRACLEAFEGAGASIERVRLAEGGARSRFWSEVVANVLGRPVERVVENDTSAFGAALLARAGVSGRSIDALAASSVVVAEPLMPSEAERARYGSAYERFMDRSHR